MLARAVMEQEGKGDLLNWQKA